MSSARKTKDVDSILQEVDIKWRGKFSLKQVGVLDNEPPDKVVSLASQEGYDHVVQLSGAYYKIELNSSALIINNPSLFDDFPVSSIPSPQQAGKDKEDELLVYKSNFSKIDEKRGLLDNIELKLNDEVKSQNIKSDIITIADELVTNAIYNAPFVKGEDRSGASRGDKTVQMHGGDCGTVFVGLDNSRVMVGCKDPYGTLDIKKLFDRIIKCYEKGLGDSINFTGPGGAGIGSYMIYNSSVSFYVGVRPGYSTITCGVLPRKASARARAEMPKNLHFFNY